MLKRVGGEISEEGAVISIKEASFPVPFKAGLEFNSPVHGNWNIVHTGMLMPEARQIYVCADNCMRGVVLTAAEMNAADRFSFVILEEENLLNGNLEDITIEGVSDVLNRLPQKPKAVLLFTVCLHHFLGCDLEMVYHELENRFPDICFVRCYMDPIMQKHGLTPDQKLRKAMYDPLKPDKKDPHTVTITGSDFALDETSDLKRLLRAYDYKVPEMPECHTWEEYQRLGEGSLFVTVYPPGKYGGEMLAERLKRQHLYLPGSWNYEEIRGELQKLAETLGLPGNTGTEDKTGSENRTVSDTENKWTGVGDFSVEEEIRKCEEALQNARVLIGDTPIALDYLFHPRPLGLAKLLLTHGFHVETVYLDSISTEEKEDFLWLQKNCPDLMLKATIQVKMRVLSRKNNRKILAIGQKAAWFTGSRNFVNMVQGGGLYGFDGIRRLCGLMTEAYQKEKDTEDLVVRKGWGCESCI